VLMQLFSLDNLNLRHYLYRDYLILLLQMNK
jgi:hypothetical protein